MPVFLWRVWVVAVAGVAADATAKAPARKRHITGTNCFRAGTGRIKSYIGLRITYFSRLTFSLRNGRRGTQQLRMRTFPRAELDESTDWDCGGLLGRNDWAMST